MESAIHPRVVAATRVQLRARRDALERGARHAGWKIARDFAEIEAVIGKEPVLGYVTSETVLTSGGSYSVSALRAPRVETELVVEVGGGFAVGIEIVDVARPPADLEGIIAANVAHRACVIGARRFVTAPTTFAARTWINGELRAAEHASAHPDQTIHAMQRLLAAVDLRLQPGDLVLAGSLTHVEAGAGDDVVAEIEGLGRVEVQLVS